MEAGETSNLKMLLLLLHGGGRYSTTEPPALLMVTWGAVEAELGRCSRGGGGCREMGCGICSSRSLQIIFIL